MSDQAKPKCSKPGCGALKLIGKPCTDWDCPQVLVHYTGHNAIVEELRRELSEARNNALEEAAKVADDKAAEYDAEARDVRNTVDDKRFYSAAAARLRGIAAAIRKLKETGE